MQASLSPWPASGLHSFICLLEHPQSGCPSISNLLKTSSCHENSLNRSHGHAGSAGVGSIASSSSLRPLSSAQLRTSWPFLTAQLCVSLLHSSASHVLGMHSSYIRPYKKLSPSFSTETNTVSRTVHFQICPPVSSKYLLYLSHRPIILYLPLSANFHKHVSFSLLSLPLFLSSACNSGLAHSWHSVDVCKWIVIAWLNIACCSVPSAVSCMTENQGMKASITDMI